MHSEFGFLKHLKDHFKLEKAGDDCAVIPKDASHDYVITSDMLVGNIDFRLDWSTPEFIGHKALAVSISDIAAMGGVARFSLVSLGVTKDLWKSNFPDKFYEGYMALAKRFKIELIGGDISRTPGSVTIDSTVIGEVAKGKAVYRNGAKPGDLIFVTGVLGGAAVGLDLLGKGHRYSGKPVRADRGETAQVADKLLLDQLAPEPTEMGRFSEKATSMIDISDGLSADLMHLCNASNTGAMLHSEQIPVPDLDISFGITQTRLLELALHGGEDYELLFTIRPDDASGFEGFATRIGEVTNVAGKIELIVDGKKPVNLEPKGYSHF